MPRGSTVGAPRCLSSPSSPSSSGHHEKATCLQVACESGGPSGSYRVRQRTSSAGVTAPSPVRCAFTAHRTLAHGKDRHLPRGAAPRRSPRGSEALTRPQFCGASVKRSCAGLGPRASAMRGRTLLRRRAPWPRRRIERSWSWCPASWGSRDNRARLFGPVMTELSSLRAPATSFPVMTKAATPRAKRRSRRRQRGRAPLGGPAPAILSQSKATTLNGRSRGSSFLPDSSSDLIRRSPLPSTLLAGARHRGLLREFWRAAPRRQGVSAARRGAVLVAPTPVDTAWEPSRQGQRGTV
jgi:hypothetical protein